MRMNLFTSIIGAITLGIDYYFFTDKVNYKREYHGPIEIEKLQIQLFNDKGFPLTFNGVDWNITLSTEHLYKY
jgi:hypothetical protein